MDHLCISPYSPLAVSHGIQLRPDNEMSEDLSSLQSKPKHTKVNV